MTKKFTIEFDENDAKIAHIKSLQEVITKRNQQIERLTEKIEAGEGSEYARKEYERGLKEGWRNCSNHIASEIHQHAIQMNKVRRSALNLTLYGERNGYTE